MGALWRTKKIDAIEDVSEEDITMENLKIKFRTGCSVIKGSGENRVVSYRKGYATELGNMAEECWTVLAKKAIEKELGSDFYNRVVLFLEHFGTPFQKENVELEALEICTGRLFENPNWKGYATFQRVVCLA